jgi:hypothetical protein
MRRRTTEAAPLSKPSVQTQVQPVNEFVPPPPVLGDLKHATLTRQICSGPFLGLALFFSVCAFWANFYVGTVDIQVSVTSMLTENCSVKPSAWRWIGSERSGDTQLRPSLHGVYNGRHSRYSVCGSYDGSIRVSGNGENLRALKALLTYIRTELYYRGLCCTLQRICTQAKRCVRHPCFRLLLIVSYLPLHFLLRVPRGLAFPFQYACI